MSTTTISPLRQRMIEDMTARKFGPASQRSHIESCERFAAYLKRSPATATPDDVRLFQLDLIESGLSIPNRNRIMSGAKFLFRVTLRRPDLVSEIFHMKEPEKVPLILSQDETRRLLAMAGCLRDRLLLSLGYGAGLRAGEVIRLRVKHIDSAQSIIHVEQSKGRKDRLVMLSPETLCMLREWWKARPTRWDAMMPSQDRLLFPGRKPGEPLTTRQLNRLFHETADAAGINISPGSIDTRRDNPEWYHGHLPNADGIPLGRQGSVDEIAATCLFLVSEDAGFITGQTIHVNGGAHYYL